MINNAERSTTTIKLTSAYFSVVLATLCGLENDSVVLSWTFKSVVNFSKC